MLVRKPVTSALAYKYCGWEPIPAKQLFYLALMKSLSRVYSLNLLSAKISRIPVTGRWCICIWYFGW